MADAAAPVIPKAPCKKGKYITLKQFLEDEGSKFTKFEDAPEWAMLKQNLGGVTDCASALTNLKSWVMQCKKQNWWKNQGAFWWLAGGMPTLTGYAFSFIPTGTYDPAIFTPAKMMAPFANPYCVNPNTSKLNPQGNFEGFKAHGWKCDTKTIDPETLAETVKKGDQRNDNTIVFELSKYAKSAEKEKFKKLKFDYAMNKDYTVKEVYCDDAGDIILLCEANAECLVVAKCVEGIVFLNWAQQTYKGARPPVGSLRGKGSQALDFLKLMHEANIFTMKDEDVFP